MVGGPLGVVMRHGAGFSQQSPRSVSGESQHSLLPRTEYGDTASTAVLLMPQAENALRPLYACTPAAVAISAAALARCASKVLRGRGSSPARRKRRAGRRASIAHPLSTAEHGHSLNRIFLTQQCFFVSCLFCRLRPLHSPGPKYGGGSERAACSSADSA